MARFARDPHGGEELKVDGFVAKPPASAAHAADMVGTEVAPLEPFDLGLWHGCVVSAEKWLDIGVGADVGACGLSDRRLVDRDYFFKRGKSVEFCAEIVDRLFGSSCIDRFFRSRS